MDGRGFHQLATDVGQLNAFSCWAPSGQGVTLQNAECRRSSLPRPPPKSVAPPSVPKLPPSRSLLHLHLQSWSWPTPLLPRALSLRRQCGKSSTRRPHGCGTGWQSCCRRRRSLSCRPLSATWCANHNCVTAYPILVLSAAPCVVPSSVLHVAAAGWESPCPAQRACTLALPQWLLFLPSCNSTSDP